LCVDAIQGLAQRKRQNGVVGGEHGHGGPEHAGLQSREQPGDLPGVGRDEVAIGSWWTVDLSPSAAAAASRGHLVGSVLGQRHAQQIRHLLPEIAIAKAINEVMKHSERQQQRHHPRLAELQPRRLLAVFGDGRLHHALDAVARSGHCCG